MLHPRVGLLVLLWAPSLGCSNAKHGDGDARTADVETPVVAAVGPTTVLLTGRVVLEDGSPASGYTLAAAGEPRDPVAANGSYALELPAWRVAAPVILLDLRDPDDQRRWALLPAGGHARTADLRVPQQTTSARLEVELAEADPEAQAWIDANRWQEAYYQRWLLADDADNTRRLWAEIAADIDAQPDVLARSLMQAAQFGVGRGDPAHGLERTVAAERALAELGIDDPCWSIWPMALPTAVFETGRWDQLSPTLEPLIASFPQPEVAGYITYERYLATITAGEWAAADAIWAAWRARPELGETMWGRQLVGLGPERRLAPGNFLPALCVESLAASTPVCTDELGPLAVVELWSIGCQGCVEAFPKIDATVRGLAAEGIEVEFTTIEVYNDGPAVEAFFTEHPVGGRHALVAADQREAVREAFGVVSVPELIIVGPDRRILDSSPLIHTDNLEARLRYWHAQRL